MRFVAFMGAPAPYTTPFLNALAKRVDLHAVYLSGTDRVTSFQNSWGVEPEFERTIHWRRTFDLPAIDLHAELTLGTSRHLRERPADAIMVVSWKPTVLEPLFWSRWKGIPAVMWSESTRYSGLLRDPVSTLVRRSATRAVDAFVTNGSQATAYLVELGAPAARIVTSRLPAAPTARSTDRANGQGTGVRFLFVGRLIARKRPLETIAAFDKIRDELPDSTLTVVGGGELEEDVRRAAEGTPDVTYAGFREGDALAPFYERADVLVVPSLREVWGIVVNEALAHGLFVVATDEVGSAHDLLDPDTGVMLPAHELDRLAPTLLDVGRRVDFGDDARRRRASTVAACTPERFASDILRAAHLATDVRAGRGRRGQSARRRA